MSGSYFSTPGAVQRLAQYADDGADQQQKAQSHCVRSGGDLEGMKRADEEVCIGRSKCTENGCYEPRPETTDVSDDQNGRDKGHVQDPVPQHHFEGPAEQERDRRGQQGETVDHNQLAASCFVHADPVVLNSDGASGIGQPLAGGSWMCPARSNIQALCKCSRQLHAARTVQTPGPL